MDFGVVLQTDPPAWRVVDLVRRAETLGFGYVWTFDSHILWQEPFVIYSQMLSATQRMVVGPMVTNPGSRDWTVTASLFATLNDMFGNRTVCGIGRGDSARRVVGKPPNTLATLRDAIRTIRALANGRSIRYGDTDVRIDWAAESRVEVWGAGYGPRALHLVGEEADGVILQLADPFLVEWMIGEARAGAEAAGRDPDALTVCVAAPAYVGDDLAHQRDQVRWFGGMVGNHVNDLVARYGDRGDVVPAELTDYIAGRAGYDYSTHGKSVNKTTDFVPDAVVDRFCLLGPPEAHVEKLGVLRELGVDQFAVYLMHDAQDATLDAYGEIVIPAMS